MYTFTWKKYLPVIRLHLKKAAGDDQVISLNRTDFEKGTKLRKPAVSFAVEIKKGRFATLNPPVAAKDLFEVITQDAGTMAILLKNHYAISMNSDFQLSIKDLKLAEPAPPEENPEQA